MLKVENIMKTFAKNTPNEHLALHNLSLEVPSGDFVTVLGSNGAGKSTLFNAICGSFLADGGKIILDDEDISFYSEHKRAKLIGRVFQDPMKGTAPNMTIEENLALAYSRKYKGPLNWAIKAKDREFFRSILSEFGMGLEDRLKTKVGLLSGGQRQVVTLTMCTMVTPKLLLLDEHTAALDPATADKVMEITQKIVRENNLTTLMITHNMKQALTTGNRTIMLDSGEIIMDVREDERDKMTVDDVLEMYSQKKKQEFANDRMLLS